MTTDERIENLERVLPSGKRRNRWLLAAVGLGALAVVWPLGASMSSAEVAPSAQEQPGSPWAVLVIPLLVLGVLCLLGWRRRSRLRRRLQAHKITIELTCPICGEVMSAPVVPPPLLHDGVKVGQTATCPSCGKVSLVGIERTAGWLVFPAMVLIVSPLTNIVYLVLAVADYGLGGLFTFFVALTVGFIVFQVWVAVVFLMTKPYVPKLVVALLLANVAFALITRVAVRTHADLDQETGRYIGSALVLAVVWIPYFLVSRRVKATFSRKGVAWPIQQEGLIVSQGSGLATTPPKIETQADEGNTR
ncbi:MAG: DUF2569 family protein [Planctomycetes bacterium]|nr:DUF2569 family protein [Planctomycetota bacterium]